MRLMSGIFFILFYVAPQMSYAANDGVAFKGSVGLPTIAINNPDGSLAGYEGVALQGKVLFPLTSETKGFGLFLSGALKYMDLENAISSTNETEVATHRGFGPGIIFQMNKIFLSYDYMLMNANHYYIGDVGINSKFDYKTSQLTAGVSFPVGKLDIGFGYSIGSATLESGETGLRNDSALDEETVWFQLTYASETKVGEIARQLVK